LRYIAACCGENGMARCDEAQLVKTPATVMVHSLKEKVIYFISLQELSSS